MTLNVIETFKTSIYNPKHTNNTKIHYQNYKNSNFPKNTIFQKKKRKEEGQTNQRFMRTFIALFIYVEGHTA